MNADTDTRTLVDLTRRIAARVETVWGILSTTQGFGAWMGGEVSFEPEAGSPFSAHFPQFDTVVRGEILEFDAEAHRLTVSWGVEAGPQADTFPVGSSRVEITLTAEDGETRARLVHSALPSEHEARQHEAGWRFHLSRLALQANRQDLARTLPPAIDAWFAAWNETDPEKRAELLARACVGDVEFRDEYAEAAGRDLLSVHIGNYQKFVPDWKIEAAGPLRICRGAALVPWTSAAPDGQEVEGMNHLEATPDGRIHRVTGFMFT